MLNPKLKLNPKAFKYTIYILVIVALLLFIVFSRNVKNNSKELQQSNNLYSDSDINTYGNNIANWSNTSHAVVFINGFDINFRLPNSGGFTRVVFVQNDPYLSQNCLISSAEGISKVPDCEKHVQSNLSKVLRESSCKKSFLDQYINNLSNKISKDNFATDLSCLGRITYQSSGWAEE